MKITGVRCVPVLVPRRQAYGGVVKTALGAAAFSDYTIVFVDTGDHYLGERILTALTVVLFLGGSAWFTGRVRERYGNPPWGRFEGGSE